MVETITPVVYGGRTRWTFALALHVAGATLTAAAFGVALAAVGGLLAAPWSAAAPALLAVLALGYALGELPQVTLPVPALRRQVPDWWRTYFGWPLTAFLYGAGLGIGFFTFLSGGALVVVAAGAAATGRPALGALLLAPFGLIRGLAAAAGARIDSSQAGRTLVDRLAAMPEGRRRVANGVALSAVAVLGLADAAGLEGGWIELAGAVLAAVFAWAAVSKIAQGRRWRRTLVAHDLSQRVVGLLSWVVPSAEAGVPALALLGLPRPAAMWAVVLVIGFSVEVVRLRVRSGDRVPCGCFGGRETVSGAFLLARNAGLMSLALLVALRGADHRALRWPGAPDASGILPLTLAFASIVVAIWTVWRSAVWLGRGKRA